MCWVWAIVSLSWTIENPWNLSRQLLRGSKNRWQDGYGLSLLTTDSTIHTFKFQDISQELVNKVNEFSWRVIAIITHARYPTSWGKEYKPQYVQPFEEKAINSRFTFAFNGNIVNAWDLAEELAHQWYHLTQDPLLDTEVLKLMILKEFDRWITDQRTISQMINDKIDGCCNMILMGSDKNISLSKDRWGFRPLAYARKWDLLVASSESSVLFKMGLSKPKFVKTWEIVEISINTGRVIHSEMNLQKPNQKSRCFFEAVYFVDEKTELWWTPSSNLRYRMWQELAERDMESGFTPEDTVVVDIPSSARHSAQWYADTLWLTLIPAIIKSPNAKRTFIEQDGKRKDLIKEKYIFNEELKPFIKGKKVVLMDDSIVRGATLEHLVQAFIEFYEPAEVHIRIPSPPIVAPCFYGINMAKKLELIAPEFFKDILRPTPQELWELAEYFHAHSIKYISIDGLVKALQVDIKDICLWCITWKYPTPCGQKEYDLQMVEYIIDK